MSFGERHPFPVTGSPTRLRVGTIKLKKGDCIKYTGSFNNSFNSLHYIQPKDSEPFVNVKSELTWKEAGVS